MYVTTDLRPQRFEHHVTYRSADRVHAVRLTERGHIPITHVDEEWLKRLRAAGRLHYHDGKFFVGHGTALQTVLPGEWIVWHERSDLAERLLDAQFRSRYETDDREE